MPIITRKHVIDILSKWQSGQLSASEVHNWAENKYLKSGIDYEDWEDNDDESVTNEVLANLDTLDMNLVTKEDIPIFLEFLKTPNGKFKQGYKKLKDSLNTIDIVKRKEKLSNNPLYLRFCK